MSERTEHDPGKSSPSIWAVAPAILIVAALVATVGGQVYQFTRLAQEEDPGASSGPSAPAPTSPDTAAEDAAIAACESAVAADFLGRHSQSSIAFSRRTVKRLPAVSQWIVTAEFESTGEKAGTFGYGCRLHGDGKLTLIPPASFDTPTEAGEYVRPEPSGSAPTRGTGMTDDDVDRLTTYATVLGRASGCGIDVTVPGERVGNWLLGRVKPGFEKDFYPKLLMKGVVDAREAQLAGRSPDDCSAVRRSYARFTWPG